MRSTIDSNIRAGVATCSVVAAVLLAGCTSGASASTDNTPSPARQSSKDNVTVRIVSTVFLRRYVNGEGRVVRIDQGGDTVSEGQAYAMLIALAADDSTTFLRVWAWSKDNLLQPDGLLASSWDNGAVVDAHSASDADLDIARALLLASARWHSPSLEVAGRRYAEAILTNETVTVGSERILVAGPWARSAPYWVDPSYFDPTTYALLAVHTGTLDWRALSQSSAAILSSTTDGGTRLPANWASVDSSGAASSSGPPGGGPTVYGYDAFRVIVRQSEDCAPSGGHQLVDRLAPLVARTARVGGGDTFNLDATSATDGDNPVLLIAAAASAASEGHSASRDRYLHEAQSDAERSPSYFLDAWVALGWILLTTPLLGGCAA
jgi:endo-1,4-beta-D-glucanase Y